MKRAFTFLALLTTFGLMQPTLADAAPRRDKHKSSHVSKHRHHSSGPRVVSHRDGRGHAPVVVSRHHYHHGYVRSVPVPVIDPGPRPYYYGPRRGLFWFLFGR